MPKDRVFHENTLPFPSLPIGDRKQISASAFRNEFPKQAIKRMLDIIVASLLLFLLAPLFALIAIAIKLESPGPIIFRQRRLGLHGRPFEIAKFRTMTVMENGAEIAQATRNDPRVTRVGRFLRRSSMDELPQLANVLFGQMSLVGPRPHAVAHDLKYGALIPTYNQRSAVKPGITGWAQINRCRGETRTVEEMQQRVEKDLWYVQHWTPWLDCLILLRTFRAVAHFDEVY